MDDNDETAFERVDTSIDKAVESGVSAADKEVVVLDNLVVSEYTAVERFVASFAIANA